MDKSKQLCFYGDLAYVTDQYDTMASCLKYFQLGNKLIYENEAEFAELMQKWLADDKSMKSAKLCYSLA